MRWTLRNLAATLLAVWYIVSGKVSKSLARAKRGEYILSVYFHEPDKKLFTTCVKWLMKKGFHFISTSELKQIMQGAIPFPKGAVLLTADDGWKSNNENIIEIANRLKIPITIFLTVDPIVCGAPFWWSYIKTARNKGMIQFSVEEMKEMNFSRVCEIVNSLKDVIVLGREALTEEQINDAISHGKISIGSHTMSHPILPKCSDERVNYEIKQSKDRLEAIFKTAINSFAYPNGSFTERETRILEDSGYEMAFTTELRPITPESLSEHYAIPRMEVLEQVSFWETICRMSAVWEPHTNIKHKAS
jgi:poly-beta-1,6-N-acetyl-D-glucosamine N-deacetylase